MVYVKFKPLVLIIWGATTSSLATLHYHKLLNSFGDKTLQNWSKYLLVKGSRNFNVSYMILDEEVVNPLILEKNIFK